MAVIHVHFVQYALEAQGKVFLIRNPETHMNPVHCVLQSTIVLAILFTSFVLIHISLLNFSHFPANLYYHQLGRL